MTIFVGSSHPRLGKELCLRMGISPGALTVKRFPDGELSVSIDQEVRGKDVFVLQSIAIRPDNYLMELLVIVDALKRAAPRSVTAIIPYFGYGRQDRKDSYGKPITAKLVAKILSTAGVDSLITFDLHSEQIEGFFEIPVEHYSCLELLGNWVSQQMSVIPLVVAPDLGGVKTAKKMARTLGSRLVIIDKTRISATSNNMTLIGDVFNSPVLIFDDLCSTGGTIIGAARLCKERGASKVVAAVTHPVFSHETRQRICKSPIECFVTTDTVPCISGEKVRVVSIANMLKEILFKRINSESICQL